MLLIAEGIFIGILITILVAVFIEEAKIKKSKVPKGSVDEYWDGRERRKAIRVDTSLSVKYIVKKDLNRSFNGQMKNISRSGMKLVTNEKLTNGTLLMLEFELLNEKEIIVEGKVVWTSGEFSDRDKTERRIFYTGIQFMNIKSSDENRLADYITKITGKTYKN